LKTEFKNSQKKQKPIVDKLRREFNTDRQYINNVINLFLDGSTAPFIARYRKEMTGKMSEDLIHRIITRFKALDELSSYKKEIIDSLKKKGKDNPILLKEINSCTKKYELDDIYSSYKVKEESKASAAKQKGLEPLAIQIYVQKSISRKLTDLVSRFINSKKELGSVEETLEEISHIITEWISEDLECRRNLRESILKNCTLKCNIIKEAKKKDPLYGGYHNYSKRIETIPFNDILHIFKGEKEGILSISISAPQDTVNKYLFERFIKTKEEDYHSFLEKCVKEAFERYILPNIEGEIKKELKSKAFEKAQELIGKNLRAKLLSPPAGDIAVMSIKPGIKRGCKVVVMDGAGNLIENIQIFPHPPQKEVEKSIEIIKGFIEKHGIKQIVLANGSGVAKTEEFIKNNILTDNEQIKLNIVDETLAKIYANSNISSEEYPQLDEGFKTAIFVGKYFQNPIAELVKVNPIHIYGGDHHPYIDKELLEETFNWIISSCVNFVGVDLNTASYHLLKYVSGLDEKIARDIVKYREGLDGGFTSREELKKVPGMTPKVFEQCAGFLRIKNGFHPLDATFIHPENYHIVSRIANKFKCRIQDLIENAQILSKIKYNQFSTKTAGFPTIRDIIYELGNPRRDPRKELSKIPIPHNTKSIKDLTPETILNGKITKLTHKGAYVDIGVGVEGFVRISEISKTFVKDPSEILSIGETLKVKILSVDSEKKKIALSIKRVQDSPQ